MKTRLYLDARKGGNQCPLMLGICRHGATAYVNMGVYLSPEQWDARARTLADLPPKKWPTRDAVRNYINNRRAELETALLRLEAAGELHGLTAGGCKTRLLAELNPDTSAPVSFLDYFAQVADRHNARTRELYLTTCKRIREAIPDADRLTLEDITPAWLARFDRELAHRSPSVNARNIHHRNIRAVINAAIDDELTANYAFRKFKLHNEETAKRSLTLAQLRRFLNAPAGERLAEFRDVFRLMLYLCGINATDLYNLTADNIRGDRLEYRRAKTGKLYSVKIEPETAALFDRYVGRLHLLGICDRYATAHELVKQMDLALKQIIPEYPFNTLSTYWARHTYATLLANELDAPVEVISAALGHAHGSRITAVYINYDRRKVDDINRRLIDVLEGK